MENHTRIRCDETTLDVIKNFINDYMNFNMNIDDQLDCISTIQKEIRIALEPYMKERLDYLKKIKFGNGEFYSLFMLIIVIDKLETYDWKNVNEILYFNYNPADKDTMNYHGMIMRDNYFKPVNENDNVNLSNFNCCCRKTGISLQFSSLITNGRFTFILGSECIQKTSIEYSKVKKAKVRRNIDILNGVKYCDLCAKKLPDDFPKWKTLHKICYKRRMGYIT